MTTDNQIGKSAMVTLPLTAMRHLYSAPKGKKMVVELDIEALKKVNEPSTIDEMVAEARFEYFTGQTKGYAGTDELIRDLET